ncbi:late sexual development protein [Diaporthe eres]|uniref:Late sexual development protein n=1 Tax=Diaporthe vaccinii TaxID=105482 RepID=A0ABR4F187_9PEZI|nr:late sexual development protein [Diaporthe eres]
MYAIQILKSLVILAGATIAAPTIPRSYNIPAGDGFPNPSSEQLATIQQKAGGQLSNAPPPSKLASSSLTAFQLIAFNENFEVAYFSSLIDNITNNTPGFQLDDHKKRVELLSILEAVKAQEELHAINAKNVLTNFGAFAPPPCSYKFPTADLNSSITLAETFTAFVLGVLQDASQLLATNGDAGPVRSVASVIGQEGEQNGWYRTFLGLKPSEKPFLTTSVAAFAFSVLQGFVDSCPFDVSQIDIPIFPTLSVLSGSGGLDVEARDQALSFEADLTSVEGAEKYIGGSGDGLFITYLTGQNLPISQPVTNVSWDGKKIKLEASFPFSANVMEGLSVAALTTKADFATADDVVAATLAAPGLIQVNDKL